MQFLDISYAVNLASLFHCIGVFAEKTKVNDSTAMVLVLKVRIREANEYLFQLIGAEVVGEVTHRVCPEYRDIVARVLLDPVGSNLLADKVHNFISDLESDCKLVGEQG